jgi:hypothetical protein
MPKVTSEVVSDGYRMYFPPFAHHNGFAADWDLLSFSPGFLARNSLWPLAFKEAFVDVPILILDTIRPECRTNMVFIRLHK